MDEISITERLRWHHKLNQIVGTCYNHKHSVTSYEFKNILNLVEIKKKLNNGEIHLAKECFLITIAAIGVHDRTQKIILNLPICSHKNGELITQAIQTIVNEFNTLNPSSEILNFATDGDPNRRKAVNKMRSSNKFLTELMFLRHFDQKFVLGEFGVNYDPKHIIKRLRSALIGNTSIQLIKRQFSKEDIRLLLRENTKESDEVIAYLMDQKDKQNVPSEVRLLNLIKASCLASYNISIIA